MLILADNDVGGAVTALRRMFESDEFCVSAEALDVQFIEFEELRLPRDASDRQVWQASQEAGAIPITGNRASGDQSLENTIQEHGHTDSLPIVTLADRQRVIRDRSYTEKCVLSLLDLIDRIHSLRGTGRLFVP